MRSNVKITNTNNQFNKEYIFQHDLKIQIIQIKGQSETISMLKKSLYKLRLDKYGCDLWIYKESIKYTIKYLFTDLNNY